MIGGMHVAVLILNHINTEERQRGTTEKLNDMDKMEIQKLIWTHLPPIEEIF